MATETSGTETFDWDKVLDRRREIAAGVQLQLGLSFGFGVRETFYPVELTDQGLAGQPMWRVPFYVVAHRMIAHAQTSRVIDHAWWLLADDRSYEPWGFVTEPYMDREEAHRLAKTLGRLHEDWGIVIRALPRARSGWNPGHTVPIIVTASIGCLPEFLRYGVGAALEHMSHRTYPVDA